MHKLTAHDAETQSLDGVADNIAKLTALFPEILTEGADGGKRVDFAALRELLGTAVEDKEERYNFTWYGKREARRLAQTPSTGTLRPCPAESRHWDSTQNLFIEGDNLEVLKLLQKSYHQRVKMIYIDPPYNTGKDFIKAITLDTVEGIAKLKDELQPEDSMMRVVFRDSGFADDVVKVNAVQILKHAGIEDVRSV